MGALGRHDAGQARRAQHVALHGIAGEHQIERLLAHDDAAFRNGKPFGRALGGDIDHARLPTLIDMGELGVGEQRRRLRLFLWTPRNDLFFAARHGSTPP